MDIEINKDVPVPTAKSRNNYPYKTMQIGDSFLVTGRSLQVVCNANWRNGKALGKKFIARRSGENVRVWRTE